MLSRNSTLVTLAGAVSLAVIGTITAPTVRAAIKAALVEVVIPSKPYFQTLTINPPGGNSFSGPDTAGTLGVSSITITNHDPVAHEISFFQVRLSGGATHCFDIGATETAGPELRGVFVPALSTLHLPFPTPLVFSPLSGHTCIGTAIRDVNTPQSSVDMTVFGFIN